MASRGLRMRSFYYGKITNKITAIKKHSVKTIYNVHEWVSQLLTMLILNSFVTLMTQICNYNLDLMIHTLLNQTLTPVYVIAWR